VELKSNMALSKRIYSIDLLRFIAAFSVLMFHYTFYGRVSGNNLLEVPELSSVSKYGYFGVHLFFIISGFVILLSIQKNSISKFIKSRITRLYPAYWFCLLLTFSFILFFGGNYFKATFSQFAVNITMFNSFFGIANIDGVYWSLQVEIIFYLLIFLYLILKKKFKSITDDGFIYLWLILSFFPFVIDFDSNIILKLIRFILIFKYSSFFIAGMLFYKIFKNNKLKYKLLLIPTLFLSILSALDSINKMSLDYNSNFSSFVTISLIVSFYVLFYLITTRVIEFINKPIYLKIGLLTYPLYLIHQVIGYIIFNHFYNLINNYLLLFFVTVLMISISFYINKYIEIPLSRYIGSRLNNFSNKIMTKVD
jgi:peptidoglycan/LPS O-acetylase OafA/YrhL